MRASYGFARQLGPAKVTAGLSIGRSDYPLLYLNSGIYGTYIGPRDDRSIYGDLTFFFSDYDYAGFAPTLRLRAGHSDSNIDIYSSREVSISLGLPALPPPSAPFSSGGNALGSRQIKGDDPCPSSICTPWSA